MPYQDRKPAHLATLVVPHFGSSASSSHTPLPCTPIPFEPVPLVMTPDTPAFHLDEDEAQKPTADEPWSEAEDAIIASYLNHPPRPLRTAYPPDSLPPPAALDELTTQLVSSGTWPSQDWRATRSRFFDLAQKHSASYFGAGRKRQSSGNTHISARELFVSPIGPPPMDLTPMNRGDVGRREVPPPVEARPVRPKLRVLGGAKMSRQQHSMDSLYGDQEVGTMSEALRLSNTLQSSAQGELAGDLSGNRSLSSPLAFTFSYNTAQPARKSAALSSSLPSSVPRPSSLLNRGRSFTSQDFPSIPSTIDEHSTPCIPDPSSPGSGQMSGEEDGSPVRVVPDMMRSASSPPSSFTTSPPSSVSSATSISSGLSGLAVYEEAIERDELEPFTPLSQIFPNSLGLRQGPPPVSSLSSSESSRSGHTTPAGNGRQESTPAITLTAESPEIGGINSTPTLIAPSLPSAHSGAATNIPRTVSPSEAERDLARLSISPEIPSVLAPLAPPTRPTARASRPTPLSRSYSEGMRPPSIIPTSRPANSLLAFQGNANSVTGAGAGHGFTGLSGAVGVSGSRGLLGPIAKRQRGNSNGLSVFVPRPNGRGWAEELRSPFEHKTSLALGDISDIDE